MIGYRPAAYQVLLQRQSKNTDPTEKDFGLTSTKTE